MAATDGDGMVPLAVLLRREMSWERIENPDIIYGEASESKKGEDFTLVMTECQRVPQRPDTTFSVFAVMPLPYQSQMDGCFVHTYLSVCRTDLFLERIPDSDICARSPLLADLVHLISSMQLFDGHNGSAAAIYSKENLLNNVLSSIPSEFSRNEWVQALPRALVAGFIKTDKDFKEMGTILCKFCIGLRDLMVSGTTVTFVIIDGWVVTVASVGDSRCVLESAEGSVYFLSTDHRLEDNEEEYVLMLFVVERITTHGGEVGRMNVAGGAETTLAMDLRCWPGGLCLSRSIGDQDVGEFILPIPHVKQVKVYSLLHLDLHRAMTFYALPFDDNAISEGKKDQLHMEMLQCSIRPMYYDHLNKNAKLSNAGGRLVISSDGVWDALSAEKVLSCCRGLPAEAAAFRIVKEAVQPKGIRDDTTCIVVDILPPEKISPSFPNFKRSGKGMFKSMFRRRSSESSLFSDRDYSEADMVEEIFEDGSPVLAHRLDPEYSACPMFRPFNCAICQLEMKPGEGISLHDNSTKHGTINPWDGPFLCAACNTKKEAMEGRR
ncbi:hypothetical protein ZIOFF_026972 [Zingiber officinale]|uniref:protein-serine/threonine phosphatase n=1 Tax=Zingiber officinale TaxID=94328 RepID=A0A8J5GZJ2_ZINOF|nr:hypothetical protein ZIOFF_026972 [Zingiber officinale]